MSDFADHLMPKEDRGPYSFDVKVGYYVLEGPDLPGRDPHDPVRWTNSTDEAMQYCRLMNRAYKLGKKDTAAHGWREIGSAPRDGTRVLGFDPMRGIAVCHCEPIGKWYPSDEAAEFDGFFQPTLWQPLPPLPDAKGG